MASKGYIDETGVYIPTYDEILEGLKQDMREIYGADLYLEADSQDGQALGIFALAIADAYNFGLQVYNSFSPQTAQGVGLSQQVAINGIKRKKATYSTADVLLTGTAGTVIIDGVVEDTNSNKWKLPSNVVIGQSGTVTVTATAVKIGAIYAGIGEINKIFTPTIGWQQVTNLTASNTGDPIESDAELRGRQTYSVAQASQTVFAGILGGVAQVEGVGKLRGYENPTDTTDSNGIPPNSIALVVSGGDATEVATKIALHKTPGIPTYGTTSISVSGVSAPIYFSRPVEKDINVAVSLTALGGFLSSTEEKIIENIFQYLNNLKIGESVYRSKLYTPANSADPGKTFIIDNIQLSVGTEIVAEEDIILAFADIAVCSDPSRIVLNVS